MSFPSLGIFEFNLDRHISRNRNMESRGSNILPNLDLLILRLFNLPVVRNGLPKQLYLREKCCHFAGHYFYIFFPCEFCSLDLTIILAQSFDVDFRQYGGNLCGFLGSVRDWYVILLTISRGIWCHTAIPSMPRDSGLCKLMLCL